jgi:hypothetical protein
MLLPANGPPRNLTMLSRKTEAHLAAEGSTREE